MLDASQCARRQPVTMCIGYVVSRFADRGWLRRAAARPGLKFIFGTVEILDHGLVVGHLHGPAFQPSAFEDGAMAGADKAENGLPVCP